LIIVVKRGGSEVVGVEQWAEVRRMHRVEGLSGREISRRTGLARDTVARLLGASTPPKYAPGPARDVAARQAATGDDRDLEQLAGGPSTLIGFAFVSYAPQVADITVAVQGPQGAQGVVPLVMRWVGDDWRFVVPPDGQQFAATQVTSMAGFVPWSAG